MTRLRLAAALACGTLLAACGGSGGGTGPTAGTLTVTYATPHVDDGAVLVTLSGAQVDSVTSFNGYVGYSRKVNADSVVVVVAGPLGAGPLFSFTVPDKNATASYHVHITQVAQRSTYAQRSLSGYSASVGP